MNASDAMSLSRSRGQIGNCVRCRRCSDDRQIELIQTYGVARYFCATCSYDWDARQVRSAETGQ
jgi:transposase-like protein